MEETGAEPVREPAQQLRVPSHGAGRLAPPFTPERAVECAKLSAEARKGKAWSWEERARRLVSRRLESGQRRGDKVLEALVTGAEQGDTKAIELLAKLSGWRPEKITRHEHGLSRDLRAVRERDQEPAIVEAEKVQALPASHEDDKSLTSENGVSAAQQSGPSSATNQ